MVTVRALSPQQAAAAVPRLSDILIDCVEAGASVSFMAPLDRAAADDFWRRVVSSVAAGDTMLLVAECDGSIGGTVQVQFATAPNQPHRGDIAKMLVHSRFRRRGLGATLLRAAEAEARNAGRTLLVLDTQSGSDAERLYAREGWTRVGVVPNYALKPYGGLCDTTFFFKTIAG
jgi:GNAT superfamily N-acetyltransferase